MYLFLFTLECIVIVQSVNVGRVGARRQQGGEPEERETGRDGEMNAAG